MRQMRRREEFRVIIFRNGQSDVVVDLISKCVCVCVFFPVSLLAVVVLLSLASIMLLSLAS